MKPIVTVIVPVYNTEEYLAECLYSICEQTLREIELICGGSLKLLVNGLSMTRQSLHLNLHFNGTG